MWAVFGRNSVPRRALKERPALLGSYAGFSSSATHSRNNRTQNRTTT
ncbi:unnamed protein product, partial [Mesorhabditis belari]|uniref:Uncharacterized protein n=1 Tax=Mesorhabditis belari TaxID=2138241 RepID=A0AAF3E9X2_9BILA